MNNERAPKATVPSGKDFCVAAQGSQFTMELWNLL